MRRENERAGGERGGWGVSGQAWDNRTRGKGKARGRPRGGVNNYCRGPVFIPRFPALPQCAKLYFLSGTGKRGVEAEVM